VRGSTRLTSSALIFFFFRLFFLSAGGVASSSACSSAPCSSAATAGLRTPPPPPRDMSGVGPIATTSSHRSPHCCVPSPPECHAGLRVSHRAAATAGGCEASDPASLAGSASAAVGVTTAATGSGGGEAVALLLNEPRPLRLGSLPCAQQGEWSRQYVLPVRGSDA
jgi:hypothetical protein